MHAHEACDGPVHASVCEDGALRCVVWERRGRQSVEPRREGVEDSEIHNTGAMHGMGTCASSAGDRPQTRSRGSVGTSSGRGTACSEQSWPRNPLTTAPAALMWCRDPSSSAVGGVRLQGVRKRPAGGPAGCAADLHTCPVQEALATKVGCPSTKEDIKRMLFRPIQAERFAVPMD